jgi:hypothetical protein
LVIAIGGFQANSVSSAKEHGAPAEDRTLFVSSILPSMYHIVICLSIIDTIAGAFYHSMSGWSSPCEEKGEVTRFGKTLA